MNVNEVMSREPRVVRMGERLDAAARVLWEQDCGIVPVVDGGNVVVGVLTDRDLCMATYTQGRPLNELPVAGSMARAVRTCRPEDTLATAMATMHQLQVHRLPVVDVRGVLVGIVSTNDLVRAAQSRPAAVDAGSIVKLLAGIGASRRTAAPAPSTTGKVSTQGPAGAVQKPPAVAVATASPTAASTAAPTAASAKPTVTTKAAAAAPIPPAAGKQKPKPKGRKA